jgi:hypothetical protein
MVEDREVSLCAKERMRDREAARAKHGQDDRAYFHVLNNRGDDTEYNLYGAAQTGIALFCDVRRR